MRQEIAVLLQILWLVRQMCAKSRVTYLAIANYIAKTPVFLSKTGVFLVAEGGLEPPTSGL